MGAIDKLNQAVHFLTDSTAQQPLQTNYTLTSLPLAARVLSPKCLKNSFFLWSYRIISLPFLLLALAADSTLGNLYRLTLGNYLINTLNQKTIRENQQKSIRRMYIAAGAVALFTLVTLAASFCLKSAPIDHNDFVPPNPPVLPNPPDGGKYSIPPYLIKGAINGVAFLSVAYFAAWKSQSPSSFFITAMSVLALVNKSFFSPFGFLGTCTEKACSEASFLPSFLRPVSLLTHFFEMNMPFYGILVPTLISVPMIIGKMGGWFGSHITPAAPSTTATPAREPQVPGQATTAAPPSPVKTALFSALQGCRWFVSRIPGSSSLASGASSLTSGGRSLISQGGLLVSNGCRFVSRIPGRSSLASGVSSFISGSRFLIPFGSSLISGVYSLIAGGISGARFLASESARALPFFWANKLISMIPFFHIPGELLLLIPFNRIADNLTNSVEETKPLTRYTTYTLSAIYALANTTLIMSNVIMCRTGLEVIAGGAVGYYLKKNIDEVWEKFFPSEKPQKKEGTPLTMPPLVLLQQLLQSHAAAGTPSAASGTPSAAGGTPPDAAASGTPNAASGTPPDAAASGTPPDAAASGTPN